MADHQPPKEPREASERVPMSIRAVPARLREALTASPHKGRNRILAAGCCAVAALLIGAGAWAAAEPAALPAPGEPPAAATLTSDDGGKSAEPVTAEPVAMTLGVAAEGYTDESSPLVAVVTGTENAPNGAEGAEVDFAHAVSAEEVSGGTAAVDLKPGTYTISFISPINEDGSIYRVPDPVEVVMPAQDDGDGDGASDTAPREVPGPEVRLDPVPADQVTKERLEDIRKDLADAVAKGDGTLAGALGSEATDKAEENAS